MKKILIVEDEPSIADNIRYALTTEGFDPVSCATGGEAKVLLEQEKIDLMILDVGLPDISGFELCKELRKKYTLPILFLTAREGEIDRVVGLEIGADDYVTKPFSPRELTARIKAILRRTENEFRSACAHPSFQINEERYEISYCDRILDLSRYEYKILKVLLNRPGRVFTRDELMGLAWDEPDCSMDRTIDAHIKNIRAEIKSLNLEDPIETHRGLGYSLKEKV